MGMITKAEQVKVENLVPYRKNAKEHSADQVKKIANSIEEFGFLSPLLIDAEYNIIAGHGRLAAAKKLGLEEVPCVFIEGLSDAQRRAYILADNKLTELGDWNQELLGSELQELSDLGFDIEFTGFDLTEYLSSEKEATEEDEYNPEIDEDKAPKTKPGDIYALGRHRLICGDSTKAEDVEKLMNGEKADLVFTDPPYGMKKEKEGVANDNLNYTDLLEFNRKWIPLTFDALKDNGSWYCWGIDEPLMDIYSDILKPMIKANKITFRNLLTWDKGSGQGQLSEDFRMYPIADEKCLFVMAGVQGFSTNADNYFEAWEPLRVYLKQERDRMGWNNADMKKMCGHSPTSGCHWFDKSQWVMPTEAEYKTWQKNAGGVGFKREYEDIKREYEDIKREYEDIKREYYSTRAHFNNTHDNMNNVWHIDRAGKEERVGHATPKPIALCARAIKTSSREGELVLDVFGGSGSTLIACEQLNRVCYMCELEPHWCDVIIDRWETFTGQKARRIT